MVDPQHPLPLPPQTSGFPFEKEPTLWLSQYVGLCKSPLTHARTRTHTPMAPDPTLVHRMLLFLVTVIGSGWVCDPVGPTRLSYWASPGTSGDSRLGLLGPGSHFASLDLGTYGTESLNPDDDVWVSHSRSYTRVSQCRQSVNTTIHLQGEG